MYIFVPAAGASRGMGVFCFEGGDNLPMTPEGFHTGDSAPGTRGKSHPTAARTALPPDALARFYRMCGV